MQASQNNSFKARELVKEGERKFNENNFETALRFFNKAISTDPECTRAYNNLASFLFLQKKVKKAIETFEFIINYLNPSKEVIDNYITVLTKEQLNNKLHNLQKTLEAKVKFSQTKPVIHVATSIAPHKLEMQRLCIRSWQNMGMHVTSLNNQMEIEMLQDQFPGVEFKRVDRDGASIVGKPLVYFDDIIKHFSQSSYDILGIINSDILLLQDETLKNYLHTTPTDAFVYGSRVDTNNIHVFDGKLYTIGFDYFFFNKSVLDFYTPSKFLIGAPWWDYWSPYAISLHDYPLVNIQSPIAFHQLHPTNWDPQNLLLFGREFCDLACQKTLQLVSEILPEANIQYEYVHKKLFLRVIDFLERKSEIKRFEHLDQKYPIKAYEFDQAEQQ